MRKTRSYTLLNAVIAVMFLFNSVCSGLDIPSRNDINLAPPSIFQKSYPLQDSSDFRESVISDVNLLAVCLSVAKYFLVDQEDTEGILKCMRDKFRNDAEKVALAQELSQNAKFKKNKKGERIVVHIPYIKGDDEYLIKIYDKNKLRYVQKKNTDWGVFDEYGRFRDFGGFGIQVIPKGKVSKSRDIRGEHAERTDPIIERLIKEEEVIEVYFDGTTLNANRVEFVENYARGQTPYDSYLDDDIDLGKIFSDPEIKNLKEWIHEHMMAQEPSERGKFVRFRIVLGRGALQWTGSIDTSNISHAGKADRVIYIGGLLLRELLKDGQEDLRRKVFDEDEFMHLKGLDHGTPEEYQERLGLLEPIVKKQEELRQAILEENWKYLLEELKGYIKNVEEDPAGLYLFLEACNEICLSQTNYPVESKYPILRGVTLLSEEEEITLKDFLNKYRHNTRVKRQLPLIDSILLMIDEDIPEYWLDAQAPSLKGRNVWQIASEIWYPLGGLGRVMQYHGVEMNEILKQYKDTNLRHIEPFYHYKRDKETGKLVPLEYSALPIPLTDHKLVAKFEVTVGGEKTEALCYRVRNPYGVETYLIRDRDWKYTNMAYNYSSEDNPVSWEDFSEFFSRASLELVRFIESQEKERTDNHWKAPVIHTNDAQVALFDLFKDTFYSDDMILKDSTICFTTHTYFHRHVFDRATGEKFLKRWGIPKDQWGKLHHRGDGWVFLYDVTSGGSRTADWTGGVSRRHVDDVALYDKWQGVNLVAVTNGDLRAYTAKKFREIMLGLYPEVNMNRPTAEQVLDTKKEAKRRLGLDPEQYVVSYSGRLVPEKAGAQRAFTENNIERLVRMGVQVVYYGNIQVGDERSVELDTKYKSLYEKIERLRKEKPQEYTGRFVFVDNFDMHDQHSLLAATDVQIQDSDEHTEAAGYTEADISACGGLQMAPPYPEGILQAQGLRVNLDVAGEGNTLIPEDANPESYFKILKQVLSKKPEELAKYQATSVRLSRVLDARLTAAEYLRQFSDAVYKKEKQAQKAHTPAKGNLKEALSALYYSDLRTKKDISVEQDFWPKRRGFGRTTVYQEISGLKELNIVVEGARPQTWQLRRGIRNLPEDLFERILEIPGMEKAELSRLKGEIESVKEKIKEIEKSYTLKCARERYQYIGISMGGNKLAVSLVDGNNNIIGEPYELRWDDDERFRNGQVKEVSKVHEVMDAVVKTILTAALEAGIDKKDIRLVSAALAGPVDKQKGIYGSDFKTPNLPFDKYPFRDELIKRLKMEGVRARVRMCNDAEASRKGEHISPNGLLRRKSGGIVIIGGGINISVDDEGIKECGHNLYQVRNEDGTVHYAWGGRDSFGRHPIEVGNTPAEIAKKSGSVGEDYNELGHEEFKTQYPDYPMIEWQSGLRDFEDRLSGPSIRARVKAALERAKSDNGQDLDEYLALERTAYDEAIVGKKRRGEFERALNHEAMNGNEVAIQWIRDIASEIGQALATFISEYQTESFARNLVLVSGISENLGKGVYENDNDRAKGLDMFMKALRESASKELVGYFVMDQEKAEKFASGIVRSNMDYERELVWYKVESQEVLEAYKSQDPINGYNTDEARDAHEEMLDINDTDMKLLPPVKEDKILWHVIHESVIPVSIRGQFINMLQQINRTYPDLREKIVVVTNKQDFRDRVNQLAGDSRNIVDVAVGRKEYLEELPEGVKGLVFKHSSNFVQLEGVIAALRALQQDNTQALISLYEMLTGKTFEGNEADITANINNPRILANMIIFNLKKLDIYNSDDLETLNKNLLKLIQAA